MFATFAVGNTTRRRGIPKAELRLEQSGKTFPKISNVRYALSEKINFQK